MALTSITVDSVTPRGGATGVRVVILGAGFGVAAGSIAFDPLGLNVAATPVVWQPDRIEFDVPTLSVENQFLTVAVSLSGNSDGFTTPFWVPSSAPLVGPLPPGMDYQWPAFEEGDDENEDDPRTVTAADLNRVLDRVSALGVGGALPPLAGLPGAVLVEDPVGTLVFRCLTSADLCAPFAPVLSAPLTLEVGQQSVNPQFNASYAGTPGVPNFAELDDDDGNPAQDVLLVPNPITRAFTYVRSGIGQTVRFTLSASESGGPLLTDDVLFTWLARAFWGVGAPGQTSEAFIEALANNALASARQRTFTVDAAVGESIYYAYPESFGDGTFFNNGFEGGFLPKTVVSVTNPFGVTMNYNLYESALTGLGSTTIEVR
jgi:hypothetical protein